MTDPAGQLTPSPELEASWISRLFFLWSNRLMKRGHTTTLKEDNLWDINPREKCKAVYPVFQRVLDQEKGSEHESKVSCSDNQTPSFISNGTTPRIDSTVRRRKTTPTDSHVDGKQSIGVDNGIAGEHLQSKHEETLKTSLPLDKHHSLWLVIFRAFWKDFLKTMVLRFLQFFVFWITHPYFLSLMVEHSSDSASSVWVGTGLCGVLFLLLVTIGVLFEHAHFRSQGLEMHIRSALKLTIFRKAMNLTSSARKNYSVGSLTNIMGDDADSLSWHVNHLIFVIFNSFQIVVVFYQLFNILGLASVISLVVSLLLVPVNMYVGVKLKSIREKLYRCKDRKMKLLNEILTGMKVVKLHAWEKCFADKLDSAREEELQLLRQDSILRATSSFSWDACPSLISMLLFYTYFYLNGNVRLTPGSTFAVISLLNMLRHSINLIPEIVVDVNKINLCIGRLDTFLNEEDFKTVPTASTKDSDTAVEFVNASFAWGSDRETTLRDIDVIIPKKKVVAVVGKVGSGKSSFISAILGEIQKTRGHVGVQGRVAYVPQQAWIQNNTVQDNILFGKPMNRKLYQKVIHACALEPDLDVLVGGDQAEIGERGINLSGGQKQRVSLARALYNDADIYLLDDPLSAVDSHVGKHIFEQLFGKQGMIFTKTCIFVTHNIRYLPDVDNIIVMNEGRIADTGSFQDLLKSDGVFQDVLKAYMTLYQDNIECLNDWESVNNSKFEDDLKTKLKGLGRDDGFQSPAYSRQSSEQSVCRQLSTQLSCPEETTLSGACMKEVETRELSKAEIWDAFLEYMKTFGTWSMIGIGSMYAVSTALWAISIVWLTSWTSDPVVRGQEVGPLNSTTENTDLMWEANIAYLQVYCIIGFVLAIAVLINSLCMTLGIMQSARRFHHNMLMSVLKSPMEFFDTTPIGRITGRFTRDIRVIDQCLPYALQGLDECGTDVLASIVVAFYSSPYIGVLLMPILILYQRIQLYHTKTSKQLDGLEQKADAPIESLFTESVMGTEVIRAYRAQDRFLGEMESKVDTSTRMMFYGLLCHRWMGIQLLGVGNVVCAGTAFINNIFRGPKSATKAGLGATYSAEINSTIGWFVILQSDVERCLLSVERIMQYTNSPNEASWRCSNSSELLAWPSKGHIEFRDYSLRYRKNLNLVLRNISFLVAPGEKLGIVGRTGAGKSSLVLALFRLVEPAEGTILIDGVDITTVGLHDLREKLAIIPQDPVLFCGSLRMNLDPQDQYTDEEIWTALDHAHIKSFVQTLPNTLSSECGEGGTNFSVGQRQLFCLARTLLRKAKILVLDEATAAVDMETDDLIQQTIRSEFKDCTVLTIAHRLNTIMDSDRILVLDQGELQELGTPNTLLKNKGSFYKMAMDAGLVS